MGREIRRVPPNWEHPQRDPEHDKYRHGGYQPMYDERFEDRFDRWLSDFDRIRAGNLDDLERECYPRGLADWLLDDGAPHDPAYYRPWSDDEATWYQAWETVSEGTPVSPPFATQDELIDYLAKHGDFWDQKRGDTPSPRAAYEKFVKETGWAPSMVLVADGRIMTGVEAL